VTRYGTGRGVHRGRTLPWVAGKSGTSQAFRDAWFIGYSDRYVVGVWMGHDDNASLSNITGGSLPAQLWADLIAKLPQGRMPATLRVLPQARMTRAEPVDIDNLDGVDG